jgi:hypothetical protein
MCVSWSGLSPCPSPALVLVSGSAIGTSEPRFLVHEMILTSPAPARLTTSWDMSFLEPRHKMPGLPRQGHGPA